MIKTTNWMKQQTSIKNDIRIGIRLDIRTNVRISIKTCVKLGIKTIVRIDEITNCMKLQELT